MARVLGSADEGAASAGAVNPLLQGNAGSPKTGHLLWFMEHGGKIQVIFRYLKQMEKRETERVLLAEVARTKPRRAVGFKVGKGKK